MPIQLSLEETILHLDHTLKIDYGNDDKHNMEYTLWCEDCDKAISNTMKAHASE